MANLIGAFGIAVSDLKKSEAFYTTALGMKAMQRFTLENMEELVVGFEGRGAAIVLMQYTDGVKRDLSAFAGKLVFYFDDVQAAAARIRAAGCAITREPEAVKGFGGALIGFGLDPDGYTLELIERR